MNEIITIPDKKEINKRKYGYDVFIKARINGEYMLVRMFSEKKRDIVNNLACIPYMNYWIEGFELVDDMLVRTIRI